MQRNAMLLLHQNWSIGLFALHTLTKPPHSNMAERHTLRSIAMKGIVACTARNHAGLNLRTWTRAAPDGALATPEIPPT